MFLYLSAYIIAVVHEFGHYIIAKVQGRKDISVQIGKGPSIRIGDWTFGLLLTGGKTTYYGEVDSTLLLAGGTISTFILHLLLLPSQNVYILLFNLLNLVNLFGNIVPVRFLGNDGYLIAELIAEKFKTASKAKL